MEQALDPKLCNAKTRSGDLCRRHHIAGGTRCIFHGVNALARAKAQETLDRVREPAISAALDVLEYLQGVVNDEKRTTSERTDAARAMTPHLKLIFDRTGFGATTNLTVTKDVDRSASPAELEARARAVLDRMAEIRRRDAIDIEVRPAPERSAPRQLIEAPSGSTLDLGPISRVSDRVGASPLKDRPEDGGSRE